MTCIVRCVLLLAWSVPLSLPCFALFFFSTSAPSHVSYTCAFVSSMHDELLRSRSDISKRRPGRTRMPDRRLDLLSIPFVGAATPFLHQWQRKDGETETLVIQFTCDRGDVICDRLPPRRNVYMCIYTYIVYISDDLRRKWSAADFQYWTTPIFY